MQKSRAKDIRDVSRDTLVKILDSLGIAYFSYILKELRHALTRGYQVRFKFFSYFLDILKSGIFWPDRGYYVRFYNTIGILKILWYNLIVVLDKKSIEHNSTQRNHWPHIDHNFILWSSGVNMLRLFFKIYLQLHVLSYTVHTLLKSLLPKLQPGDLDGCLGSLIKVRPKWSMYCICTSRFLLTQNTGPYCMATVWLLYGSHAGSLT